ncbi:hypothetical protein H4R18_000875 [Coemansia javaensis]|uniref:Myb-like domain-containing protein n=1 Tax=Coemansia javaensis TaxID=2761396 RepID=A0A9W8LM60_9FUNG|nr:hypothetical protein H4R18_000875 [Coemansia javaensis]
MSHYSSAPHRGPTFAEARPGWPTRVVAPTYEHVAAELSEEEIMSALEILEGNYHRANRAQLLRILSTEHPLCLEADLIELLDDFLARKSMPAAVAPAPAAVPAARALSVVSTGSSSGGGMSPSKDPAKYRSLNTEDPEAALDSKWTPLEIDRLRAYLMETRGRKNWVACAQRVGSKSSAQCKAKYNNMRAQSTYRSIADI